MRNKTRTLLAGGLSALCMLSMTAVASAEDPLPATDSQIVADTGVALDETVQPLETAAGEQTCTDPPLFNPLQGFKDARDYFVAPAGTFETAGLPGWQLEGG